MRALDLFTGSGSVARALQTHGWEVDTLDINPACAPTFCTDIRDFDFAALPADAYDFVWASPDCRTWSLAAGARHRKLGAALSPQAREADTDVAALLAGLRHLRPRFGWVVENPRGHLRRHEPLVQLVQDVGGDRTTVFYSNYGYYTHKPTDLWSSKPLWPKETKPDIWLENYKHNPYTRGPGCLKERALRGFAVPEKLLQRVFEHMGLFCPDV